MFFKVLQSHYFENPIHLHNLWTAIQEDYFLAVQQFLLQGVPKKVYNRMLLELQRTGYITSNRHPLCQKKCFGALFY